jgi:sortase A
VLGEILVTLGVVILLYVLWQIWIGDVLYSSQHNAEAAEQSREWAQVEAPPAPEPAAGPYEPVVLPQPADREVFANLYVPRWGDDYRVRIAGGVTRAGTLDKIGIGHYLDTEMPGEVGNFGLAAHRTTFGAPFANLQSLRIGDPIVIETEAGWYTYRFRTLEYVPPSAYDALADVPRAPDAPAGERYITLTSCSPRFAMTERIVAYGAFESFLPRASGETPPALTEELI